jgi:hypothetical protein
MQPVELAKLSETIASLQRTAGPGLRVFIDTYDLPFSAQNALIAYGQRLINDVVVAKEHVAKLCEIIERKR